jgi:hypothetical protein
MAFRSVFADDLSNLGKWRMSLISGPPQIRERTKLKMTRTIDTLVSLIAFSPKQRRWCPYAIVGTFDQDHILRCKVCI